MSPLFILAILASSGPVAGEQPVAPYEQSDANAGARPFEGTGMATAFHGQAGIRRIADDLVTLSNADSRTSEIFMGQDHARLRRTLFEQFCFILNAGCSYTGRNMRDAHKDMGLQHGDMNALVEILQRAMMNEGVNFTAQNRFLAKLAPMRPDVVER